MTHSLGQPCEFYLEDGRTAPVAVLPASCATRALQPEGCLALRAGQLYDSLPVGAEMPDDPLPWRTLPIAAGAATPVSTVPLAKARVTTMRPGAKVRRATPRRPGAPSGTPSGTPSGALSMRGCAHAAFDVPDIDLRLSHRPDRGPEHATCSYGARSPPQEHTTRIGFTLKAPEPCGAPGQGMEAGALSVRVDAEALSHVSGET